MADDRIEIRLPKDADVTIRVEPGGRPTVQSPYVDSEPTPTKYSDDVEDFLRTFDPETASPEDIERAESISKEMAAQMFTSDPTRDGIDFVPSRLIDGHPVLDVGHVTPDANLDAVRNLVASLARSRPDTTLRIVEVGPWLGATTIALTQGFGPAGGFVFAIDSWKGTPHGYLSDVVEAMGGTEGVYNAFRQNINTLYNTVVKPVNTISLNAIATLDIGQVDMVFYDGSYVPTEIVDNLRGWMKLVAPDGVLAGQACGPDANKALEATAAVLKQFGCTLSFYEGTTVWAVSRQSMKEGAANNAGTQTRHPSGSVQAN